MTRLMAGIIAVTAVLRAGAADAADKLVLQLNGPARFEFAGYYAALWQGFYRDAGFEVEIKPGADRGQPPIYPVREVTEGRAQFGVGGVDLVVRIAQGSPLLLLAPIFQESGAAVYYRADSDFASPAALAKAKIGRMPASDVLDIEFTTALRAEGVDAGKIRSVPLSPGQTVDALADHSVDAAIGSAWDVPWLAYEKGLALKSFNPADYRVEFYGDTLFTLQRLDRLDPQMVRAIRAASLKGWEYALQHPDEIAQRMIAELPHPAGITDVAGFDRYESEVAQRLSRYPEIALGHANPDRWDRIEASMIGVGAVVRTTDADEFVFDPDAAARNQNDRRAWTILGATLAGGVIVAVWLWLRRRRPPIAVVDATAGEPPVPVPVPSAAPVPPPSALPVPAPSAVPPPAPGPTVATGTPAAPLASEPAEGDLNAVLTGLERVMRQRVPRRVAFRLSLLRDLWPCRAEAPAVHALVLDLLDAACVDLKGSGELIVGTRNISFDAGSVADTPGAQIGEFARLTLRDNGPGLSEEALSRIFDRAQSRRPSAAVAAEAMRALGGFARVESAEGVGTAVHLYFHRAAAPAEAAGKESKPAEAAE